MEDVVYTASSREELADIIRVHLDDDCFSLNVTFEIDGDEIFDMIPDLRTVFYDEKEGVYRIVKVFLE